MNPEQLLEYEIETVIQRFEMGANDDADERMTNHFDDALKEKDHAKDIHALKDIFAKLSKTDQGPPGPDGIPMVTKKTARKIVLAISQYKNFFNLKTLQTMEDEEILKLLHTCVVSLHNHLYSCQTIIAACYAYNENEINTLHAPGEEASDMQLHSLLKLSKDEEFEFRIAFSIVAGSKTITPNDRITRSQIDEVFLALGYSMQDEDIQCILRNIDEMGDHARSHDLKADHLKEAYEEWRQDQVKVKSLKAMFNMLCAEHTISSEFPHHFKEKVAGNSTISHESIKNALNKVLHLHGAKQLQTDSEEVQDIIAELTSHQDRRVTVQDFVRLFSVESDEI